MEEKQFIDKLYTSHQNAQRIPSPSAVCNWLEGLLMAMFPELANRRYNSRRELEQHYRQLKLELFTILETMEEMLPVAAEELEQACGTAVSYGACRLKSIRNLLKRPASQTQQALSFIEEHPIIRPLSDYSVESLNAFRKERNHERESP